MVVPIRKLANKLFSTTNTAIQSSQMAQILSTMDMDINNDIVREKFTSSTRNRFRELFILLNTFFIAYYE